jgi:hypothetical protein
MTCAWRLLSFGGLANRLFGSPLLGVVRMRHPRRFLPTATEDHKTCCYLKQS